MVLRKLIKNAINNNDSYKDYVKKTLLRNSNPYSSSIKKDFVLKVPNSIETKEQKLEWAMSNLDKVKTPTTKEKFIAKQNNPTTFDKNVIEDFDKINPQSKLDSTDLFLKNTYERGYDTDYNTLARKGYLENIDPMSNYESYIQALEKGSDLLNKTIQKSKIINPVKVRRELDDFVTNTGKPFKDLQPGDILEEKGFTSTTIPKEDQFKMTNLSGDYSLDIQLPGGNKQSFLNVGKSKSVEFPEEREILLPKGLQFKLENITPEGVREFSIVNPYSLGLLAATGVGVSQMKRGNRLKFKNGGSIKPSNIDSNRLKLKSNTKPIEDIKVSHKRYLTPSLQFKSGGSLKDKLPCNNPVRAAAGKKQKYTVKACTGTGDSKKEKLLHFGLRGMQDYLQHKDKDRRKSFKARMKCDTAKDKLTRRWWACNYNWK